MNEAETRAELIDPKLSAAGWGVIEGSKVLREFHITEGRIQAGGKRAAAEIADYILVYKNQKIGVIEAKAENEGVGEGVAQAKAYAAKLSIDYTFSANGREIYQISMRSGKEEGVKNFPTPDELWAKTFSDQNEWKEKFAAIQSEGQFGKRFYQEIAINRALDAVAEEKKRILLTLATGTGKTIVAFQIAWKLFQARWNLKRDGKRQPRILFLADRNILADQAFLSFNTFPKDALVRINPLDIRKKGGVPTNGSVFFTIFQTFMSGKDGAPYFGEYPPDFFDFIIIDECHRGGANDEGNWRAILDYFSPAVQLGLTATPKRKDNVDTYKYFGDPIYSYSLKEGINDGFLTPFKVKRVQTTLDEYIYTTDDEIVEGEVEEGRVYQEPDFNTSIEIVVREAKRVQILMDEINQNEKTIVFCANQGHAAMVRDLINQTKKGDPFYCVRVTANDGARGEQFLREFQDNEKTIPTILTTSQKLSTGVDARNVRNIVLMRPVNSMIEFKQIIGRGTRVFDGKEFFTIYDFVGAYKLFADPEWDGEAVEVTEKKVTDFDLKKAKDKEVENPFTVNADTNPEMEDEPKKKKIKIKLRDGKEREIQHMISTSFWGADGKPVSVEEFMNGLFGAMPEFFKNEEDLRKIWSNPTTRKAFLDKIAEIGYGRDELETLQRLIDAEQSDLFDVLSYVSFLTPPVSRAKRVEMTREKIFDDLDVKHKEFLAFVLTKYEENGVDELDEAKLPVLLNMKYHAIANAEQSLGDVLSIRTMFFELQKDLYSEEASFTP